VGPATDGRELGRSKGAEHGPNLSNCQNRPVRLWEIVRNAAAAEADATALVAGGRRWTFAELEADVAAMAASLCSVVDPGDRVGIVSDNRAAFVTALYGVPRAGGALALGNTRHTPAELADILRRCSATVLMATAEHLDRLRGEDLPSLRHRVCLDGTTAGAVPIAAVLAGEPIGDGGSPAQGVDTAADGDPVGAARDARGDDEMAWLLYTSGTTGRAKGAMLTHRSIIAAVLNTTLSRPVEPDEVYLFPFPLFHVAAYNVVHHHLRRRPVVLLPRFDAAEVMATIEAERVTSVSLAPTMLAMLLDHPERARHDLSSLRTVSYGAAAMPLETLRRSLAEWPAVGLAQGYGMTELSGNAVFLSPEDHRRAATVDPSLLGAAGKPAPLAALRIVDDDGSDVAPGEVGEILVRGDQVCAGYFEEPDLTASAIERGWLRTGDVGQVDRRGYLYVVDRKKDIIITGGENVSSREVEDAIGTHPCVRSVAVVGVADPTWGEAVVAVVVRAGDEPVDLSSLRAACSGLAGFKHPRAVVEVDDLPTNASGKVDKVALRELAARSLA
jgi:acyl-CoA synthetase (AMP-forming)/AMP-acid ligase II